MMTRPSICAVGCVLALFANTFSAIAQDAVRDPTVPPAEAGATMQSPTGVEGMTVLVRDEKPYLMVGSRLYAPGDSVGNLRVERITEKEVWFHDGKAVIKVPRFAGIERKTAARTPTCATPAAAAPQANKSPTSKSGAQHNSPVMQAPPQPAVAPCEDAQP